jgi:hypothetical protein
MAFFTRTFIDRLYVAPNTGDGSRGFVAFLVPLSGTVPNADPELADALSNTGYDGFFIFSAVTPPIASVSDAQTFYNRMIALAPTSNRSMLWVHNINDPANTTADVMGLQSDGSAILSGLQASIGPQNQLLLNVSNGMSLVLDGTTITIQNPPGGSQTAVIGFSGPSGPATQAVLTCTLPFTGPQLGCFSFQADIKRASIMVDPQSSTAIGLMLGFQFLFPDTTDNYHAAVPAFYPLTQPQAAAQDYIQFNINIDPTDPYNTAFPPAPGFTAAYASRRTTFDFTGIVYGSPTLFLSSCYRTAYGAPLNLFPVVAGTGALPARLLLCLGENSSDTTAPFYLAPEGDFSIQVDANPNANDSFVMCGLQGTEFFQISPQTGTYMGDTLRFLSGCPAYAPGYPYPPASPVGAPQDPTAPLLTSTFTTSWATVVPASATKPLYVSQPKGSALFGNDGLVAPKFTTLFGHSTPSFTFTPDNTTLFPLVPYLGVAGGDGSSSFSTQQFADYERLVISPTRRKAVGSLSTAATLARSAQALMAGGPGQQTITTPSGLLVTLTESNGQMHWDNVLLGQNTDNKVSYALQFDNPDSTLIEALQTSDLFLVAANSQFLSDGTSSFENTMSIGGWGLQANVGTNAGYGDYRNVMIVKGKKGVLYDPSNAANSLVANPNKWTQRDDFSAPTIPGGTGPDTGQMINLSQWLQNYFTQAASEASDAAAGAYFAKFNSIATDPDWTGILFLRIDITTIPGNLSGIVAGVTNMPAFNAHHLVVEISPVRKSGTDASLPHPSTMFGLIYYVDPQFTDAPPYATLPPTNPGDFDFRLLTLKVLFENTAVKSFESYAQLTMANLFGSPVSSMGDPTNLYDNVLLKGSFQLTGADPIYNLSSAGDNLFSLDSNIIKRVEITNAVLTTRPSADPTKAISWFGLRGFIDYFLLSFSTTTDGVPATTNFDLFSFGNLVDGTLTGQGLSFDNLGISMTYVKATPKVRTFVFNTSAVTFDTGLSTPRDGSLFTNFALDEAVLLSGTADAGPDALGFLPVIPDMRLSGVSGSSWYGLKFLLNLGTPGALAGKANLNAYLLLAWSPGSMGDDVQASVSLSLPGTGGGASLISLQNVLKLSIGQLRLAFDTKQTSFLLMFTEIALKFLGLVKIPPSGSTLFYLFGNPKAGGKSSGLGWYAMYQKDKAKSNQKQLSS